MEQSTTLLTILESLISEEDIQAIIDKHKYQEVARKFTVKALVHMFVMAAANEWKSFRHSADVATSYGLPAVNYSTFSKKASAVSYAIVKDVFQLLLSRMNRWMRRSFSFPKELLLIDSTTITVGKTRLPWAPYHGERAGIKLHVALSETTEIPHKVVETTGLKHDGPLMSEFVNPQFILVADRAYFKIERVDDYVKTEHPFVIRFKTNVELFHKKSLRRFPLENSNVVADYTCQLGTAQNRSRHRHRIVELLDNEGHVIRVVTNLRHVPAETIAKIYRARWTIEVFFRWIKQNLNVPTLFGTTENAVYNQLFSALITYVLVKVFYENGKATCQRERLNFASFTKRLLQDQLPIEWRMATQSFLQKLATFNGIRLSKTG